MPPRVVATVMVLQRWLGLSDREAVQAFEFDARWKYACGGLDFDYPGFAHSVLVDMRARLARSERPKRIFEVTLEAAREVGVVSAKRVLDSTPLYDAVATQDTVTMIRSAIRQLLAAADAALEGELRAVLRRDDDYASGGKPSCDWDDPAAREQLVAELADDGFACLGVIEDRDLSDAVAEVAALLTTVLGQDLEEGDDARFRIARRVAKDRGDLHR
ncbi:MAG: transposase [Microthrixaceae bacterium]|nr:transposase [Microthrixaceae bacterium]